MMWKKFTVSLLFTFAGAYALACGGPDLVGNHVYMFKTYHMPRQTYYWDEEKPDNNVLFWLSYTGGNVDSISIHKALYQSPAEEITNGTNTFFSYLRTTGDTIALRYWTINKTHLAKLDDPWYYPNRNDHAQMEKLLKEIEQTRSKCKSPQLKERFLMIAMRIAFYLKHYDLCLDLWQKNSAPWTDKDVQRKCHLYYAGALLHCGHETQAADIYAEYEDWKSLRYFDKNIDFLQKLHADFPASKAFNFFVQNYLNQYQDKQIMADADLFEALCKKAASDKRTGNPALWQSALAHLSFLNGDVEQAIALIEKASKMKGDAITIENLRMLRLVYHAAHTNDTKYEEYLQRDMPWLLEKTGTTESIWADNYSGFNHYISMLWRVTVQHAVPQYSAKGNHNMAAALLNVYDEAFCYDRQYRAQLRSADSASGSMEYGTNYFAYLDNATIDDVKNFLAFVKSGGKTDLEKALIKNGFVSESMINELIATKYMRLHNYQSAIQYLEKVKPTFWKKQNITDYLGRNPFHEKWISNTGLRGKAYQGYNPAAEYKKMPTKLQFCKIMTELEKLIRTANDNNQRAALNYAYAVGLYQSENYCWAHTQYAQGSIWATTDLDVLQLQSKYYNRDQFNGKPGDHWEYRTSGTYILQQQYKEIYSHLSAAEKQTENAELLARCQYMRGAMEMESSHEEQCFVNLLRKYGSTKFVAAERGHCDRLLRNL